MYSRRESARVNTYSILWNVKHFSPNFPAQNSQTELIIYTLTKNVSSVGYKILFCLLRQACIFRRSSLLQNGEKSQTLRDSVKTLKLIIFVMLSIRPAYTDLLKNHENPLICACSVLYVMTP